MKNIDWNTVNDQELTPGGYICRVVEVEDVPEKDYLIVRFDIAEGGLKGYFTELSMQFGSWPAAGQMIRSYKPTALRFFKGFVTALEKSNPGFRWDASVNADPNKAAGLRFGATIGEEEYLKNGQVKTCMKARNVYSTATIEDGKFKFPEIKRLSPQAAAPVNSFASFGEDDTPLPWD